MVSIIITVFNIEDYLEKCISSFVEQYDGSFEIILVNDGSTDGSPKICDLYSAKYDYISVIHKKNGGASSARNAGLYASKHEFVIFFDGDDYPSANYIKKISSSISLSNADITFIEDARFDDKNGKRVKYIKSRIKTSILDKNNKEKTLCHLLKIKRMRVSPWSMVIKRDLLLKNNIVFKEGIALEDVEWAPRVIINANSFAFIKGPIYMYRVRQNSLSHSKMTDWKTKSIVSTINSLSSDPTLSEYYWFINAYLCNFYLQTLMLLSKDYSYDSLPMDLKQLEWIIKCGKNTRCKICSTIYSIFGMNGLMRVFRSIS